MTSTAYELGCKYATAVYVKTAKSQAVKAVSKGSRKALEAFLGSRPSQYVAGGLGGAGLGALLAGEDNRARGAILGAGMGLGGTAAARLGASAGQRSVSSKKVLDELAARGLADRPKYLTKIRDELERAAAERYGLMAAPAGILLGGSLARPLAPRYKEHGWFS